MEMVLSIPLLLLIMAVIAMLEPSLWNVMVVIGLTGWIGIARLTRAEMLKIRRLEYIEAARALGYSRWRVLLRHALPNALAPAWVALSFGIAGAILAEASLSFLNRSDPI
jgi:peptide/nickel transport system permease protein